MKDDGNLNGVIYGRSACGSDLRADRVIVMFVVVDQGLCTSIAAAVSHPSASRLASRRTLVAAEGLAFYSVEVAAATSWTAFVTVTYGNTVRHLSPK